LEKSLSDIAGVLPSGSRPTRNISLSLSRPIRKGKKKYEGKKVKNEVGGRRMCNLRICKQIKNKNKKSTKGLLF
jgi:hypothetical protein